MRPLRLALNFTCSVVAMVAIAQPSPTAKSMLAEAQERAEQVTNKDTKATLLADVAEGWQAIDKNRAQACLNEAAATVPPDSDSWKEILRVWTKQNPDVAFERALASQSADRIGEVTALTATTDLNKATTNFAKTPQSLKQDAAEEAVRELTKGNEDLSIPFIQSISTVNVAYLYATVARVAEDPQLSLKAARLAGSAKSQALLDALEKLADSNPSAARGIVNEIDDPNKRIIAIAYSAGALNNSNPDQANQAAQQAILLYGQTPADWNARWRLFEAIAPSLTSIDSPETRDFLQRLTDAMEAQITNASDDDVRNEPLWLMTVAAAWAHFDIEKAKAFMDRAMQLDPQAVASMAESAYPHVRSDYRRYLVLLAKADPQSAAEQINGLRQFGSPTYHEAMKDILPQLAQQDRDHAREIAKKLGGDMPNLVELYADLNQMSTDAAADGLLRLDTDSLSDSQIAEYSDEFSDVLIQADPYRASRAIINLSSPSQRVILLTKLILQISKTNQGLAKSLYEKAAQDAATNMAPEHKIPALVALAQAANVLKM